MTDADGFGSTPTRLLEYLQIGEIQEAVNRCKVIIVGGEGFPPVLYERLSKFTDAEIYNSYGPTEVTIASHYKKVINKTTNEIYISVKEASERTGVNPSSISNCCRGKSKSAGGYVWEFKKEDNGKNENS